MRKKIRRSELIPDYRRTPISETQVAGSDDELFMELLRNHHLKHKYQYMKEWWQQFEQE